MTNIRITPEIIDILLAHKIFSTGSRRNRFEVGQELTLDPEAVVSPYSAFFRGYSLCTMGSFSYTNTALDPHQKVGRYCSIASRIENFTSHHPLDYCTTSPFYKMDGVFRIACEDAEVSEFTAVPPNFGPHEPAIIEDDVWIGSGAVLGRNIRIGTGAVVGAGSIVTKDVPPYAIVVGSPARIVRYRFPDALIEKLLASKWWQFHVADFHDLHYSKPELFVDEIGEAVAAGKIRPYEPVEKPLSDVLIDALSSQGIAPPPALIRDVASAKQRSRLEKEFPVPPECSNWYGAEIDQRDQSVMRFFGHKAWLYVPIEGKRFIEILVHYGVSPKAMSALNVSTQDVMLNRVKTKLDEFGRTRIWFEVPSFLKEQHQAHGTIRLQFDCEVVQVPALRNRNNHDHRNLSVALSKPKFTNDQQF